MAELDPVCFGQDRAARLTAGNPPGNHPGGLVLLVQRSFTPADAVDEGDRKCRVEVARLPASKIRPVLDQLSSLVALIVREHEVRSAVGCLPVLDKDPHSYLTDIA